MAGFTEKLGESSRLLQQSVKMAGFMTSKIMILLNIAVTNVDYFSGIALFN